MSGTNPRKRNNVQMEDLEYGAAGFKGNFAQATADERCAAYDDVPVGKILPSKEPNPGFPYGPYKGTEPVGDRPYGTK